MTDRDKVESELINADILKYCTVKELTEIACSLIANGVTVNEWISVDDRLPTEDGDYLTFETTFTCKFRYQRVRHFAKDLEKVDEYDFKGIKRAGWYAYDSEWGYYEVDDITHWMPLPQPPKEVE